MGYATKIILYNNEQTIESYYDESGEPARQSGGYYAIKKTKNESTNSYNITYLGIDYNPILLTTGYTTLERTFTKTGSILTEKYYGLNDDPVCTDTNGYGLYNYFDENGKIIRTVYVDENNDPMVTVSGYAIKEYTYYTSDGPENGKVEKELYYNENEEPIQLSLGQYGVQKGYNEKGQNTIITFLDKNGKPTMTKQGYATIIRTLHADNSLATEYYYDANGNPIALSEGQYGIKKDGGIIVYLDKDGKEKINIKRVLFNQAIWVIIVAFIVVIISGLICKRGNAILLIINIFFIMYFVIMYRDKNETQTKMELFWSYKLFFENDEIRSEILKNIWLFIPLGSILYRLYPRKIILAVPFALSVAIEITQYTTGSGLCEIDDIVSNGLGGILGYGMASGLETIKKRLKIA